MYQIMPAQISKDRIYLFSINKQKKFIAHSKQASLSHKLRQKQAHFPA
jgi:hypothetical protein